MTAPTPPEPAMVELISAINELTTVMREKGKSGEPASVSSDIDSLADKVSGFVDSLVGAAGMGAIQSSAQAVANQLQQLQSEVAAGTKSEKDARDELLQLRDGFKTTKSEVNAVQENLKNLKSRLDELTKSVSRSLSEDIFTKLANIGGPIEGGGAMLKNVFGKFAEVFTGAMKFAEEGIKNAAELAITAQQGVALEFANQLTSIKSAFANLGDPNKIVNKAQLESAQKGITEAMGGISKGLELDPAQVEKTVASFREGLNSQITPTAETFRSLAQMGIDPTTEGLSQLREASGRAGLGLREMSVLAKNAAAVQIFGQGIVKTTLDLERMGISIQSVMKQSESYVTNLDGAIDSIAQLNQLGVQLDFGELTTLQEFDPAAAIQYVADRISPEQLQSTSFRALLSSVPGVNMEEILKLKGMGGMEELESSTTKQAKEASTVTKAFTSLTLIVSAVSGSFVMLIGSLVAASYAAGKFAFAMGELKALTAALNTAKGAPAVPSTTVAPPAGPATPPPGGVATPPTPLTPPPTMASKMAGGAKAGAGMGAVSGMMMGAVEYQQSGSVGKAITRGLANLAGSIVGGALGTLIPIPGVGTMVGAMAGSWLANFLVDQVFKTMDDGVSMPGYGDRKLVTPSGTYALNNNDTVMAGTDLLPKGSLQTGMAGTTVLLKEAAPTKSGDDSALMRKIDKLISVLESAETTVVVNNTSQRVKRATLVGVHSRNEEG